MLNFVLVNFFLSNVLGKLFPVSEPLHVLLLLFCFQVAVGKANASIFASSVVRNICKHVANNIIFNY